MPRLRSLIARPSATACLCAIALAGCGGSGEPGDPGGNGASGLESIAGIYDLTTDLTGTDFDDGSGGVRDEMYLEIGSDGTYRVHDYVGDTFDRGPNCYEVVLDDRLIALGGDRYYYESLGPDSEVIMRRQENDLSVSVTNAPAPQEDTVADVVDTELAPQEDTIAETSGTEFRPQEDTVAQTGPTERTSTTILPAVAGLSVDDLEPCEASFDDPSTEDAPDADAIKQVGPLGLRRSR